MLGTLYLLQTTTILMMVLNMRLILFYIIDGLAGGIPALSTHCLLLAIMLLIISSFLQLTKPMPWIFSALNRLYMGYLGIF